MAGYMQIRTVWEEGVCVVTESPNLCKETHPLPENSTITHCLHFPADITEVVATATHPHSPFPPFLPPSIIPFYNAFTLSYPIRTHKRLLVHSVKQFTPTFIYLMLTTLIIPPYHTTSLLPTTQTMTLYRLFTRQNTLLLSHSLRHMRHILVHFPQYI